jgi:hypothetical protein
VQNDGHVVKLGNFTDVLGTDNASSNGGLVLIVGKGLSSNELTSSLGEGDHDGSSVLGSGLHTGVNGVGSHDVDSRHGESNLLGVVEKVDEGLSGDDTRFDGSRELGESLRERRRVGRKKANDEQMGIGRGGRDVDINEREAITLPRFSLDDCSTLFSLQHHLMRTHLLLRSSLCLGEKRRVLTESHLLRGKAKGHGSGEEEGGSRELHGAISLGINMNGVDRWSIAKGWGARSAHVLAFPQKTDVIPHTRRILTRSPIVCLCWAPV